MDASCTIPAGRVDRAPAIRSLRFALVPDIALVFAVLTLVWCLLLFDGTRQLFRDSDAGWHIRTGESILSGAGLPHADPYSLLRRGTPWVAWEWGADVLMGIAHQRGGLAAVAGMYAVLIAVCTWLWFRLHWAAGGNFLLAAFLTIPLLTTTNLHWHARPHVFSWVLLLGTVLYFETCPRRLLPVAIAGALWANLHASFFLLPALAVIYSTAFFFRPLIWIGFDRRAEWARARWFAFAASVGSAATLINPYGWQLHRHVFRYLTNSELLDRIGEFQSFNFHVEGAAQIGLTMAVATLGGVAALAQRRLAHFLLAVLFVAMALRSARVLPLVGLLILPLANGAITAALRELRGLQPKLRQALDNFLGYCDRLRAHDRGLSGVALLPLLLTAMAMALSSPAVAAHASFPPDQFPVRAADHLPEKLRSVRLLAPDLYGGYLIYRFRGELPVYFDGRSDFYGVQYMKQYLELIELRPGWRQRLDDIGFTHALLPNRYSLIPALQTAGWTTLYHDGVATLLAAPGARKE